MEVISVHKRVVIFFITLMCNFCIGMICVYRISLGPSVRDVVANHGSYKVEIARFRGSIYDCNMEPLTYTTHEKIASVVPSIESINAFRNVLSDSVFQETLKQISSESPCKVKIGNMPIVSDDVKVFDVPVRFSDQEIAAHVLGYTDSSNEGVCGIEKAYNGYLSNTDSEISVSYKVDAMGKTLKSNGGDVTDTSYLKNKGVVLTIDKKIQSIAELAAKKFIQKGSIIITEIPSCKIRASVSVPTFSINDLESALSNPNSPFINRNTVAFNLGSVYKLITAATALENGVSENYSYTCTGAQELEGTNFHCSNGISHGPETLKEAIAKSCNTYFVDLSKKLKPEKLLEMSKAFGFGEKISISDNFETEAGELPELQNLSSSYELANLSFGQGDLLATPVQISGLINAIASEGEYAKPSLVEGLVNENRQYIKKNKIDFNRVISQKTAAYLKSCMVESVESGTSVLGRPETGGAGAKTATAETGIKKDEHFIYQTWFAGFFPKENPKYSVVVFVEDGESGGTTCAPIFKFIADKINRLSA